MSELYDNIGKDYDFTRTCDPSILQIIRELIGINNDKEKKVLDIGCGTGNYTSGLCDLGYNIYGLDVSKYMLSIAKKKNKKVTWTNGDVLNMPFPSEYFDACICTLACHHFSDLRKAFAEVYRVLNRGRFVMMSCSHQQLRNYWLYRYFPNELEKITTKLSSEEKKIEEKKKKVEENTDLKYEKATAINTQEVNYENLEKREKIVKNEISDTISELDEKRLEKDEISKTFYEIEAKRNDASKKLEEINEKRETSLAKLKEYQDKINLLSTDLRVKDSKLKFLNDMEKEKEGYIRSVKSLLLECDKDSNLKKGMHGVLANIISVPKEYETAIEMCLGASLQNIVTDSEEDAKRLVEVTKQAFFEGIKYAKKGNRIGDISHAIGEYVKSQGYSVVREFEGHGIGRQMHEAPEIPNFGKAGRGIRLEPGMTLAIEPMVIQGKPNILELDDGWTIITEDGSLAAHYENTILITEKEPEILTII